jgi:hypothetical protein
MFCTRRGPNPLRRAAAGLVLMALTPIMPAVDAQPAPPGRIAGTLTALQVDNPGDRESAGRIVVGSQLLVVPAATSIQFPGVTLTLQELFTYAPAPCRADHQSGLVPGDRCRKPPPAAENARGWTVEEDETPRSYLDPVPTDEPPPTTVRVDASPDEHGVLVATKVTMTRSDTSVSGAVTFVSPDEGYIRINGAFGTDAGGAILRINDPEARQSVQIGRGCGEEGNCSPDSRFRINGSNASVRFADGYLACVPSQMNGACSPELRPVRTLLDANVMLPLLKGDHVAARGGFEVHAGTRVFWAHTLVVQTSPRSGRP